MSFDSQCEHDRLIIYITLFRVLPRASLNFQLRPYRISVYVDFALSTLLADINDLRLIILSHITIYIMTGLFSENYSLNSQRSESIVKALISAINFCANQFLNHQNLKK